MKINSTLAPGSHLNSCALPYKTRMKHGGKAKAVPVDLFCRVADLSVATQPTGTSG